MKKFPDDWSAMALREKDLWWRTNVFRGDMPQLTIRAALMGVLVGALLSIVNLYIGIKTGFAVGMGVTSVVLSFLAFGILSKIGRGHIKQITLLENNAVQSAATAAGYMTGLVTASLPAYMMVTGKVFPMEMAIIWGIALAMLGVLFAFPLKKRFINAEDYPFPEGKATAVVMDGLHSNNPEDRIKTTILGASGVFAAVWQFLSGKLGWIPETLLDKMPKVHGVLLQSWRVNIGTDMAMIGVGGIVGIRTGLSWFFGSVCSYLVMVPLLIRYDILPAHGQKLSELNQRDIVSWTMWPGVAMITVASLYPFLTNTKVISSAFAGFRRGNKVLEDDVLKDVELPMWVFWIGIPIVSGIVLFMGHEFFGIGKLMGAGAILLIAPFTLIAVNSTALTSFTPSSALAKLSQLYAAVLSPGNAGVNLATGSIAAEVTGNASNLLMDMKAGYLLGAKPRQQALAHVIGAIAGATAATTAFYHMFKGKIEMFGSDALPLPGAKIWFGLAQVLNQGLSAIPVSARWAILAGAVIGMVLEWLNGHNMRKHKKPFPISAIGMSLGFVTPFDIGATIALGAFLFWVAGKNCQKGSLRDRIIAQDEGGVTLASGLIAGAGLIGVVLMLM